MHRWQLYNDLEYYVVLHKLIFLIQARFNVISITEALKIFFYRIRTLDSSC